LVLLGFPGLSNKTQQQQFSVVRFKGDTSKAAAPYASTSGDPVACTGDDIAEIVHFATHVVPPHVNLNRIEVMPERQGFGPFAFNRD